MSNSIILKDILNNESCELKQTIDNYMQESFDKLQMLMKSKVDKVVSDKLDLFYNKESKEHEEILFDEDGEEVINKVYHLLDDNTKEYLKNSDKKCFSIQFNPNSNGWCTTYYYKNIIICSARDNLRANNWSNYYKHNFTTPVLFVLKTFVPYDKDTRSSYQEDYNFFKQGIDLITKHPEYFQNINSSKFEEICRKEYNDIEEKKVKLENLIQDYTNKKEYYESLERQVVEARLEVENIKNEYAEKYNKEYTEIEEEKLILKNLIEEFTNNKNYYELIEEKNNDFEKEKEELQKEKEKIIIEKEKITFIKQKLLIMKEETILMKSEIQREKEKLLEYKKNTNDIDEYFDEMINQLRQGIKYSENSGNLYEEELQNHKQNKTEFQRIINEAQKKPSYFRYKDILLSLVTKEKNNYPIYNFITPFMPSIKSHNFKHFYQSLQQPKRKDEWINIIHNTVLDIENGDYELQQMLDLIIDKCYININ